MDAHWYVGMGGRMEPHVVVPRNMRAAMVRQYVGACAVSSPELAIPREEPVIREEQYIGAAFVPYYKRSISEEG